MKNKRLWFRRLLFVVVLFTVCGYILHNLEEIEKYNFTIKWSQLALGFVSVNIAYLSLVYVWVNLSQSFGLTVDPLTAGKAWFFSQLGKYIPGKVALLLVRFDIYQGYSKRKVSVATGIEYMAILASASVLVLLAVASTPQFLPHHIRWTAGVGTVFFLFLLWPPFLMRFVNWGFRLVNRDPIEKYPSYGLLLKFVAIYVLIGLLEGLGFYFTLNSFSPVNLKYFLTITGVYQAAGLAGIAAVFAPSGIGVREGVLFFFLSFVIPKPSVIVGALAMRLIATSVELFMAIAFVMAENYKYKTKSLS